MGGADRRLFVDRLFRQRPGRWFRRVVLVAVTAAVTAAVSFAVLFAVFWAAAAANVVETMFTIALLVTFTDVVIKFVVSHTTKIMFTVALVLVTFTAVVIHVMSVLISLVLAAAAKRPHVLFFGWLLS